jgi:F-type H+-transporting ATPase subunit gamma
MKMVAAAKLRRAQDRVIGARPYAKAIAELLAAVMGRAGRGAHPLLQEREESRVIVVVVAGDRGLCGAFNTNVHRATAALLSQHPQWREIRILPVGKKAVDFWRRRKHPLTEKTYPGIFGDLRYGHAREIAGFLAGEFLADRIDAAYIVVNVFRSILSQVVHTGKLLPLAPETVAALAPTPDAPATEPLYEPNLDRILEWLLPRYLEFTIYRALVESAAAEMGARMTAMDAASKNAGELIDSLTLTYNRARQARITRELIEIVSGAAALG